MTPPADTTANEFVQLYGREAWTDWQRLLAHFDLGEGFAFLVLLLPGAVGADICRRQLAEHLRGKGKRLVELPCDWFEEARRLPERLFALEPKKDLGGVWLGAVIPESDPEIQQWQQAWRHGLASLNQQRNPLRERFACPLVLVGAPWLHTLLREAAPDLWSVRTGVVSVIPSLEAGSPAGIERGLIGTEPTRLVAGEAASDPDYTLEQAERLREKPGLEAARAQLLLRAGNGFYNHARLDPAERCFRGAADLLGASAANNPDLQARWAGALNNLANSLSRLGRLEEALAKAQEAARVREQLARAKPDAFLPDLAGSQNDLSNRLSELGRREEALAKALEAVRLYEQLAKARPVAFLPDLATSLNTLANRLSESGWREEALAKAQVAVRLYEQLAKARPDAFLPALAGSLNDLANTLGQLGRREEALAKAEDAIRLHERLAGAHPDAFLPNLAMSLNNLARRLSELGRREEALAKAQKAVRLYEQLAKARPDAFGAKLAVSTLVLRDCFHAVGKHGSAADAARKALALLKPHFLALPQAHAELMSVLVSDYMESVGRAQAKLDMTLLAPVLEILQKSQ